jgi:predicted PurR-regulated permease PerM
VNLNLSPRQQTTIGVALTALAAAVIVGVLLGLFALLARFVSTFSSVFLPLFVAMVLALVLRPVYDLFHLRWRLPSAPSVALVFVTVLLPFALLLGFFGTLLVSQATEVAGRLPELADRTRTVVEEQWPEVKAFWERYELTDKLQDFATQQADAIWEATRRVTRSALSAGASAFQTVAAGLSWFVLPVYLAFFLMAPPLPRDIEPFLPFFKAETRDDIVYLVKEFFEILVSFFRGQLVVALAQGALYGVGFMLAGLQHGFTIGFLLGLLNIVPYLGSMIGLAIALPLAFFQEGGGAVTLGLVIVVFVVVQAIEGYYLTPKVMGDRTGLHPMTIIVAIFFWGTAFDGIAGMILAIPLTAFLVVFWRLVKNKYIAEIV